MGVLNVTPDSFFDGARYLHPEQAKAQVDRLVAEGADIVDLGAESTRPGAEAVSAELQLERLMPVLEHAVRSGAVVSIDTRSTAVARRALGMGARIVNDVSCLGEAELARVVAEYDADLILMHSRGSMTTMPGFGSYPGAAYDDVVEDVRREWLAAETRAGLEGVDPERIWFDPGLGFHKNAGQSRELLQRLSELSDLGRGTVVGPSRKSFIGALDDSGPKDRLGGTIAACLRAVDGGARILRVHDVKAVGQALLAYAAFAPTGITQSGRASLGARTRGAYHDA
jgi:dihydropteroate synthase